MRVLVILVGETGRPVPDRSDWHPAECFAALYYALLEAGCEVVLASREGGPPVWGVPSATELGIGTWANRLADDRDARDTLAETLHLGQIELEDFDALICLCPRLMTSEAPCTDLPLPLLGLADARRKRVVILGLSRLPGPASRSVLLVPWTGHATPSDSVAGALGKLRGSAGIRSRSRT
ncbi:hypothetical protein [Thalassobaculum sp.]|uniref:hypothetical protein n=1 Tax=Thalassobaculum sp. TaxID=2022740 RepID=UPI003B5AE041